MECAIVSAELSGSSAQRCHEWLAARHAHDLGCASPGQDPYATLERRLFRRHLPLLEVGVARYGLHTETMREILHQDENNLGDRHVLALHCAVLGNRAWSRRVNGRLLDALFDSEGVRNAWLHRAQPEVLYALFGNPLLAREHLVEFHEDTPMRAAVAPALRPVITALVRRASEMHEHTAKR